SLSSSHSTTFPYTTLFRSRKLARVSTRESSVHIALGIEAGSNSHQVRMDVQHIGDHLCRSGFMSLTLRARTNCNHDFAVNIQLAVRSLRVTGVWQARIHNLRLAEIIGTRVE